VIVTPTNQQQWLQCAEFLRQFAGVSHGFDLRCICWVTDDQLKVVVGLTGFLGKVAYIHVAFAPGCSYSPKVMLQKVFHYAFTETNREMLIGIVNSRNVKAMRFNRHLGFKEIYRLPGMHDNGGDLVAFGMRREECRYLTNGSRAHAEIHGV
jgi:hypothetical protein